MSSRRSGGREARVAMRAAPLEDNIKPIRGGMTGNKYQVLTPSEVEKVHQSALEILETIGFADALPTTIEYCTKAGAFVNEKGRLCFPRALVEDTIAKATRGFTLYAQDPEHDLHPSDGRVYFSTAGAAVHLVDPFTKIYHESTTKDLYHAAKLVDNLDNIHMFQRTMVCRDLPDPFDMDFNTCYASVRGTRKHVGTSWVDPKQFRESMKMLHDIAGGEANWRARPFVSMSCCFVVPPLKFAQDACRCLEEAALAGMPILLLSAGQAGATSPAAIAGSLVQSVSEVLGALCYANAVVPGTPCIFGTWPFVSDLRTGAMSGGSAEQALLMAGVAQMGRHYNLTTGVAAGMADSKLPDYQAGAEKAYTHSIDAQSGANIIYESAGMHASLLGYCLETLVLDNDLLGSVMRIVRGIEVNEDTLSVDVIRQTCLNGPGHFLGSDQTMRLMQRDYFYPQTFDRSSPKEWAANGKPDLVERARDIKEKILAKPPHSFISDELDKQLRAKYPIKLDAKYL